MTMDVETLNRLAELSRAEVAVEEIHGVPMAARPLHDVTPELHGPKRLNLHTLQGLVGYLKANRDKIDPDEVVIHVEGPRRVTVVSGAKGERNQRFFYCTAETPDVTSELWSGFMDPESFTIALMTRFQETPDRVEVIRLAGNVSAENTARLQDDGFTQEITVRGGVALVGKDKVKNPVELAPYRTFHEIEEQPRSPFLLRFRGGKESAVACALFEADGGAWENGAIGLVVEWLTFELAELGDYQVIG